MDLKEAAVLGDGAAGHWYYVAKGRALRAMLGDSRVREVLDVGAGSGVFSRQLLDCGLAGSAVCVDTGYAAEWKEFQSGRPIRFMREVADVTQDLILMMDVLEHVADDLELLRNYTRSMPASARVAITVPAFQQLWSGHDVFLEHYRRYTLHDVDALVRKAGLRPLSSRYFFGTLFPFVAAMRLSRRCIHRAAGESRSDLKTYPGWLNSALIAIHAVERTVLFPRNRLAGLSVFCIASW
jgi:Methyltransferase domain